MGQWAFAGVVLVSALFFGCVSYSEGLECYTQICPNCSSSDITRKGNVTECTSQNVVNVNWLKDVHITFPDSAPIVAQDYACLKFFALPEEGVVTSLPDLLRGCVVLSQADDVCNELRIEERARERQSECAICTDPLCNSAALNGPALLLLAVGALYKLVFVNVL